MISILRNSAIAIYATFFSVSLSSAQEFGLPLDCTSVGVKCRIQQYLDMDQGPASRDPFCSTATYNGHDGTDFRVLSMTDVSKGIPIIAMSAGKVLRGRDGEPDNLVTSEADRAAIANKECGNGLLVEQGKFEVQYCHMRQGSLVVKSGDTVEKGQKLGEVGASGMAQFPHVHITVRRNNAVIDPMTGAEPTKDAQCRSGSSGTLWSSSANQALGTMTSPLLDSGIAGATPIHNELSQKGGPPTVTVLDKATIGWAWFANLQKGDQTKLVLSAPNGSLYAENLSAPLDHNKADYSTFVGRKRPPLAGTWTMRVILIRNGKTIFDTESKFEIK